MANFVNIFNEAEYQIGQFTNVALQILNETLTTINYQFLPVEVAVILIDETKSLELNQQYRQKNYVADVLSFCNTQDWHVTQIKQEIADLGDIYLCYPLAKKNAEQYGHSLFRELSFLFLHGLLHNLGYDHEEIADEKIMFGLQTKILSTLKIERISNKQGVN